MAIIRAKEAAKMSKDEIKKKILELKMELVKAGVTANKTSAKTKELKRTIARLLTINNSQKGVLKNK